MTERASPTFVAVARGKAAGDDLLPAMLTAVNKNGGIGVGKSTARSWELRGWVVVEKQRIDFRCSGKGQGRGAGFGYHTVDLKSVTLTQKGVEAVQ